MPTFFEIIKETLDQGYEEIEGGDKDKRIRQCLDQLSDRFNQVLAKGGPGYEDSVTRFAYVFNTRQHMRTI
jgi:hypothetical protein